MTIWNGPCGSALTQGRPPVLPPFNVCLVLTSGLFRPYWITIIWIVWRMGNTIRGWHIYWDPDAYPKTHLPSRFDPLYGFPSGRKRREMLATEEEMDRWRLAPGERDYCAHKLIAFLECQREHSPWANIHCTHERHAYEQCQYDDQILRMKEWERERRLLDKERRLKAKAAGEGDQA